MKLFKKINQHMTAKSLIGIVVLLLIFAVIVGIIGYNRFTDTVFDQYTDGAYKTCAAATNVLDMKKWDEYQESGGESTDYKNVWKRLDELCNATDATFIYVIVPDTTDYRHITHIFNVVNHSTEYSPYPEGTVKETTNDDYRREYRLLMEGEKKQSVLLLNSEKYTAATRHITAMTPLMNSKGKVKGIMCVQRQMSVLSEVRNNYLEDVLMAVALVALIAMFGQGVYLNKVLLEPIRRITEEADRFAEENVPSRLKLTTMIKNEDEIGQLAGAIDQMEEQTYQYIEDLTSITAEKERINAELSMANRIQRAMLPSIFPPFPERKEFDLYASMTPAKSVGGDFYDFFLIDEDHLGIVMADVSGKGVPAALFMMIAKTILQSCAMLGRSAAEILNKTNEALSQNNKEEMFVTVWLGILEISTGRITAANAGHEYPVLRKPGGTFEMLRDKHGLVIGALEGIRYAEYEIQMEPGSKLFLYTDGVPEAADEETHMFGTERMMEALNDAREDAPEQVLEKMSAAVSGFVRDAEQFDDLTMLCLEYRGTD